MRWRRTAGRRSCRRRRSARGTRRLPTWLRLTAPSRWWALTCPASLLGRDADRIRARTAGRLDAAHGVGHLLGNQLLSLRQIVRAGALSHRTRQHLAGSLCELLLAIAVDPDRGQSGPTRSGQMQAQIDRYLERNLSRPGLDANTVARENFISRSHLDRLFRMRGESISAVIWAGRLAGARRDLADPALSHEQIFEIASRWGFVSPSHFSHSFRATHGQSPRDFRRRLSQTD